MDTSVEEMLKWIKTSEVPRDEIAKKCNISRNAIDGWIYRGTVPKTARTIIQKMMESSASEEKDTKSTPELPGKNYITLELTQEQFEKWSRTALANQQILTEWIIITVENEAARNLSLITQEKRDLRKIHGLGAAENIG